jgi:hypothetical protein
MGRDESFYGSEIENFHNVVYALDIAVKQHYSGLILGDDTSRIIYASNQYAFKERARKNNGNLNLPFMNYWHQDITYNTDRFLWNNKANIEGLFDEELGQSLRIIPARVSYENSFWVNRFEDLLYAKIKVMDDESNETILYPTMSINSRDVPIPAFLKYNYSFRPNYAEQDWLEQNKIQTIGLDIEFDTLFIVSNFDIYVSKEFILNFLTYAGEDELATVIQSAPVANIPDSIFDSYNYFESDL